LLLRAFNPSSDPFAIYKTANDLHNKC